MSAYEVVWFRGEEYLLIDGAGVGYGPLATREQFENFRESYAYLFPDGVIRRYGEDLGTTEDLAHTGVYVDTEPSLDGLLRAVESMAMGERRFPS